MINAAVISAVTTHHNMPIAILVQYEHQESLFYKSDFKLDEKVVCGSSIRLQIEPKHSKELVAGLTFKTLVNHLPETILLMRPAPRQMALAVCSLAWGSLHVSVILNFDMNDVGVTANRAVLHVLLF